MSRRTASYFFRGASGFVSIKDKMFRLLSSESFLIHSMLFTIMNLHGCPIPRAWRKTTIPDNLLNKIQRNNSVFIISNRSSLAEQFKKISHFCSPSNQIPIILSAQKKSRHQPIATPVFVAPKPCQTPQQISQKTPTVNVSIVCDLFQNLRKRST